MPSKSVADDIAVVDGAGLRHTMNGPELIVLHIVLTRRGNSGEIFITGLSGNLGASNGNLVSTVAGMGCGITLGSIIPEFAAEYLYNFVLIVIGFETVNRGSFMTGTEGVVTLIFQSIPELDALNFVVGLVGFNGLDDHPTVSDWIVLNGHSIVLYLAFAKDVTVVSANSERRRPAGTRPPSIRSILTQEKRCGTVLIGERGTPVVTRFPLVHILSEIINFHRPRGTDWTVANLLRGQSGPFGSLYLVQLRYRQSRSAHLLALAKLATRGLTRLVGPPAARRGPVLGMVGGWTPTPPERIRMP